MRFALDSSISNAGGARQQALTPVGQARSATPHVNGLPYANEARSSEIYVGRHSAHGADAARLILEVLEEMPELHSHVRAQERAPLMQSLRRILREGIATVRASEKTVCFAFAAEESLRRRTAAGRKPTTLRDLRHFIRRLLRVPGLAESPLRTLRTEQCRQALDTAFAGSAHSLRKGRAIMHSIFAYGVRQGWCSNNPVAAIELPVIEEREIIPLSLTECRRLVETAQLPPFRECLPALGLMLFAGVRPGEVARLHWSDVHSDEGILRIAARHSKTGGARRVELCPPLRRLLRKHCPVQNENIKNGKARLCPPRWLTRWRMLRKAAGLGKHWAPDVLRHTFASYHALTYQNLPALQLQLGHQNLRLLLTRYLNLPLLRRADTAKFWQLAG